MIGRLTIHSHRPTLAIDMDAPKDELQAGAEYGGPLGRGSCYGSSAVVDVGEEGYIAGT